MKLATIAADGRDGRLVVVSSDNTRMLPAPTRFPTLQSALDDWAAADAMLRSIASRLDGGEGEPVEPSGLLAPLPRAWQWLDGSAFTSHGELMAKAIGHEPLPLERPLMYQGMSHIFLSGSEDVEFPREEDDIDFEGEFGVIVDDVPMGVSPGDAMGHIKLILQINDWSLRRLAGPEMRTGFGWVHAKPACSVAPFAVTPDTLGPAWSDGRIHMDLLVDFNGRRFGSPNGGTMSVGFHELVAHAAATRDLCAGTIIGSGTVSNDNYREVGSTCISERRGIEIIDKGAPQTAFMKFGDRVRMQALGADGVSVFGAIDQQVTQRKRP